MIHLSNEFIFLDNVQYNRRSWQNRVHIRDNKDLKNKKLISLSVLNYQRKKKISEIKINPDNLEYLKNNLYQSYKDTKYYKKIENFILEIVKKNLNENLARINIQLIVSICEYLNINYKFNYLSKINSNKSKEFLILDILQKTNADLYLANNGSLNYANADFFLSRAIKFKTHDFIHPQYIQKNKENNLGFLSHLSVLDVLFNHDREAEKIVKSYKFNI